VEVVEDTFGRATDAYEALFIDFTNQLNRFFTPAPGEVGQYDEWANAIVDFVESQRDVVLALFDPLLRYEEDPRNLDELWAINLSEAIQRRGQNPPHERTRQFVAELKAICLRVAVSGRRVKRRSRSALRAAIGRLFASA
jgi:hypothetical protein